MKPSHHPNPDLLAAYGAGNCEAAVSLAIATHLAFCPVCRHGLAEIEAVGGILLDSLPPVALGESSRANLLARLDEETVPADSATPVEASDATLPVPQPLRGLIGSDASDRRWQTLAPGVAQITLPLKGQAKARILRIAAGKQLPEHRHEGLELSLVLDGAFSDTDSRYERGDFAEADQTVIHHLRADPAEGCMCLVVIDAPLRLTSRLGRLLGPIFG